MGEDTTKRNCGTDEGVELFVTADSQLEMAGSDALHLEILGGVLRRERVSQVSYDLGVGDLVLPGMCED